jgi:hypothetical protein
MPPLHIWGPIIWNFIHTLAEKINEDSFNVIKNGLFLMIKRICLYLPCPECSHHANYILSRVNLNKINTKTQFKNMLFEFHNMVNKRKRKPMYNNNILEKYKNMTIPGTYKNFIRVYNTKGNLNMIMESFQRSLVVKELDVWLQKNYVHFRPKQNINNIKNIKNDMGNNANNDLNNNKNTLENIKNEDLFNDHENNNDEYGEEKNENDYDENENDYDENENDEDGNENDGNDENDENDEDENENDEHENENDGNNEDEKKNDYENGKDEEDCEVEIEQLKNQSETNNEYEINIINKETLEEPIIENEIVNEESEETIPISENEIVNEESEETIPISENEILNEETVEETIPISENEIVNEESEETIPISENKLTNEESVKETIPLSENDKTNEETIEEPIIENEEISDNEKLEPIDSIYETDFKLINENDNNLDLNESSIDSDTNEIIELALKMIKARTFKI